MGLVRCNVCNSRITVTKDDHSKLDRSGGVFVCSASCTYGWLKRNKREYKKGIATHPGIFESHMDAAFDVYSSKIRLGFRSHYEMWVAEWMYEADLGFMYEPYSFLLQTDTSSYTPDFYIPDYGCFLEVKGLWHNRKKLKIFRELYPKVPLLVLPWPIRKTFR